MKVMNDSISSSSSHANAANHPRQLRKKRKEDFIWNMFYNIFQCIALFFSGSYHYFHTVRPSKQIFISEDKDTSTYSTYSVIVENLLVLLVILLYIVWVTARIQMGSALTFKSKSRGPLLTKGLYKYFSNPIYLFGTLLVSSYIILIERYILFTVLIFVLLPIQFIRARREGVALRKRFGDEYDKYIYKCII